MKKVARALLSIAVFTGTAIYQCNYSGDAQIDKGIEAYTEGNYELAIEKFQTALEKNYENSEESEVYNAIGISYRELDKLTESISAHQKAVELDPNYHEAWVNLGIAYRQSGDLEKAEECYQKAIKIDPNYANLHISIGALYVVKGESEKAIMALEKAIKLDSQSPIAYGNISYAYAMLNRFEEADNSLQQAIALGYENAGIVKAEIEELKAIAN